MMVDTQVRPSDVTKFPIIDAMLSIPRERFVPADLREAAYVGENLSIGDGRVLLEPRTLAKLLDALDIEPTDLVLNIGCGLGYGCAVLAHMAEAVVGVEDTAALVSEAQAALADAGADNATMHEGPLADGDAKHGPYDVVLIEGAVGQVPDAILDQLAEGGRIGCLFLDGSLGVARIGVKNNGHVSWRYAFNATAPVLAGFEAPVEFSL